MIHRKLVKKRRSYRLVLSLPPLALAVLLIQKSMVTDEIIYKSPEQSSLQEKTETAWKTEYRLDESKNAYLQGRPNFASEILVQVSSPFYHNQRVAEETGKGEDEAWFIYSVATDASGAKLSANKCASLFSHNITKCVMIGLSPDALKWWKDNENILPANAIYHNATHAFQWAYQWNQREHSSAALKAYLLKPEFAKNYETAYRHIQSIVLARTFIFVDMLHHGYNVWMLDSDVVFPLDPKNMFMDPNLHCVYMLNLGRFFVGDHNEMAYSYPFLMDGSHATVNNGIVASRFTPQTLKLWVMSVDRMLNHVSGDPQHPHNQLLYVLGLRLTKVSVLGYPDLEGKFGYYEDTGTAAINILNEGVAQALPLRIRAIFSLSAYDQVGPEVLQKQVAIHAVGVGSMAARQSKKCLWLKGIGMWFLEAEC